MQKDYFAYLESDLPEDIVEENLQYLADSAEYGNSLFLQPGEPKYWDNAAKVLQKRGFPAIEDVLQGMLEWLQDANRPGAAIIAETLTTCPKEVLIPHLEIACEKAILEDDTEWFYWLGDLAMQCQLEKKDFKSRLLHELLIGYYQNDEEP